MAKNPAATEDRAIDTTTASSGGKAEAKYSAGDLCAAAREAFGVKPEVVAAALHAVHSVGYSSEEYTKAEVSAAIKKFKEKKVK